MYSNILVPVSLDDDRDVISALRVAKVLSGKDGKITLLHVVEHMPQYSEKLLPEDHLESAKSAISMKLQPIVDKAEAATLEIVEGHSGRTIVDYAVSHEVDCIVIASHRPGLQDYLLGSTAARVVRHAACAVHVVR
ncbi:Universal stress protein F [Roseovarius albus]|uniref:Universal stress protein F n=1 Tax=Roseovarius albus TaxID=1247867 RepID=A0A1X6ZYS9_9RHOB|nr:universal stress protein [Roseovarius albus]SLN65096.1 Universal stress protein F [Roseovarius albus]